MRAAARRRDCINRSIDLTFRHPQKERFHINNAAILGLLYLSTGMGNLLGTRVAGRKRYNVDSAKGRQLKSSSSQASPTRRSRSGSSSADTGGRRIACGRLSWWG